MQIKAIMNLLFALLCIIRASFGWAEIRCGLNIDWGEFVAHARTSRLLGLHALMIILQRYLQCRDGPNYFFTPGLSGQEHIF